ncbi:MAG: hypothetical protein H0X30_02855 [Anaerolineae bacterium]|nr:hypothetical protein [Anaerolineae bacterium]
MSENSLLTLTISAEGYNVALACHVDPSVLLGTQVTTGEMMPADSSTTTNDGFQTDGLWILMGSQLDTSSPLVNAGKLWTFNYQVVGTGVTQIVCQTFIGDRENEPLPLVTFNLVLTIEGYRDAAVIVSSPTLSVTETEIPITPEATESVIETLTVNTLSIKFMFRITPIKQSDKFSP